jgi:signal transduction histidine kinase
MVSNWPGVWNPAEDTLLVTVQPYFYQTVWFYTLCVLTMSTIGWGIVRWRVAQVATQLNSRLQARLEERTRIARDLHDTLLQGVLGVSMQIYTAEKQVALDSPAKPILSRAVRRVGEVIEESRQVVEDLRSPDFYNNTLEEAMSRAVKELAVGDSAQVRITSNGTPQPLNSLVWHEAYRIGREALNNALRHSAAATIDVEVSYSHSFFRMRVGDNGRGMYESVPAGQPRHWGIAGMRERAEQIGAQFHLRSRPGAGTEVALIIPAKIAYRARIYSAPQANYGRDLVARLQAAVSGLLPHRLRASSRDWEDRQ